MNTICHTASDKQKLILKNKIMILPMLPYIYWTLNYFYTSGKFLTFTQFQIYLKYTNLYTKQEKLKFFLILHCQQWENLRGRYSIKVTVSWVSLGTFDFDVCTCLLCI